MEVVGGAFLSSALAVLFNRMASQPVVDFIRGKKNTAELLYKLKMKLVSVNKLLDDAEEKLIRDPRVREWHDELKDVLYHTDDLLDDIKSEALSCKLEQEDAESSSKKSQVLKYFSSFSVNEFEKSLETRILEILKRLELIVNEKDVLNLKEGVKGRTKARLPTTSLVEESSVYGRNDEKEAIIKLLLADDVSGNKTDVLPIVGMGGMGKTTLAQLVYNNDRVKKHFHHQSWVCVLEGFDITKITQSISRSMSSEACDMSDLDMLQRKLKTSLAGKKFLIVLDDVWTVTDMEWDLFSQPFASGGIGSKIIVTTRIESVASTIGTLPSQHLLQLSEESCWMVFSKYAFKNADPSLEVIGKQIAHKCKGVPLAAKSLGSLLRFEPSIEKWKQISTSDIWELKERDILPALWLSYHYLPPHLKRCFAYCSIFPQDYEIRKPKLILLWMAEDLLPLKSKTAVEEVGDQYFDDLVSRSFFQPGYDNSFFLMHDLIHDLANFVSGEFCVRWEGNDSVLDSVCKTRHFSSVTGSFDQWDSLYEAKYLRTLISSWYQQSQYKLLISPDLNSLFLKLQCLRMLNLNGDGIVELPSSIGKLKHLRHFDLSFTEIKKLPNEISTLYNLQTLLLRCCKSLIDLPTKFGRLVNLRHLDIQYTNIKKMPTRMGKMKDLQTLRGAFVLDKHTGGNIVEIKELEQLRGTLRISGLRNIMHVPDALEANLSNKKHLEELVLEWGGRSGETDDTQKERDVLENLRPHTNLKKLTIRSYGGTRFPGWMEDHSNLVGLELLDCGNCWCMPSLERLHSLQVLEIEGFNGEVTVGSKPIPNLRTLWLISCPDVSGTFKFENFPKLESLWLNNVNVESLESSTLLTLVSLEISDCANFVCFPDGGLDVPNLRYLYVRRCRKLRSLPQDMHNLLPSLKSLWLTECPELESLPEGGLPSKLEQLDISRCKKLIENRMQWGLQTLTSLVLFSIDYFGCKQFVDSFPDEELLPITLSNLHVRGISKLGGKGFTQLTSLEQLTITDCPELRCLPHEGLPTSLSYLWISGCPSLEQRCRRETGEDWPKILHIRSIEINGQYI